MATAAPVDDDVEKILTGIMQKQSPLMKQARTQGLQQAQTAGLGQSTMGIQAAQSAAYNAAMPIASQQASQASQANRQAAQFGQETATQAAQFGHENTQQIRGLEHAASLAAQDRALEGWKVQTQANISSAERALQANLAASDLSSRERIASMEMSENNKARAIEAVGAFNNSYAAGMSQITANPDLPADTRDRLITHLNQIREYNNRLTSSLYPYLAI